ncbi:MAG: thiamine pyrophosphate enzyme-like binding protein [Gemmatimonadetes bacterium]|nr:thiamine pyrophosphate enzyme-like binding protein [Gemmatimonadota bacterium]
MHKDELTPHGGDLVARALARSGVRTLFTLCGGHISPILTAAHTLGLEVTDVRDEAAAVFAAEALGRLTGTAGVAVLTAGPGLTNGITALQNARLSHSAIVVMIGAVPTLLRGRGALQDVDQAAAARPFVKQFTRVERRRDLAPAVTRALCTAVMGAPGPVVVECPVDVLYPDALVREWYSGMSEPRGSLLQRARHWYVDRHVGRLLADGGTSGEVARTAGPQGEAPSSRDVGAAAESLRRATKPVLVLGSQAARPDVEPTVRAVERLGVPVYLAGSARGLLGREHPLLLRHHRREALHEADWVLLAGVPLDFRMGYGRQIPRSATVVAVNLARELLLLNRRPTVRIHAAPGSLLQALAAQGAGGTLPAAWLEQLRARDRAREGEIATAARERVLPLTPVALCRAVDAALPGDACIVVDGGDFVATAAYTVRPPRPLAWLDAGPFGTLGAGAGYILGAHATGRFGEIWALFGDGSLGFALSEFHTFVRRRVPLVAVVGNDGRWAEIGREQEKILGDPVATELGWTDYHRVVEGFGARGFLLDDPAEVPRVLAEASRIARAGTPVLINAHIGVSEFRRGAIAM